MKVEPSQITRFACVALVAAVFVIAGVHKITGDYSDTMVQRALSSPQAVKALGYAEIGLALWLLSFKTPRLSAAVTLLALLGFTTLIALELNRTAPLPCGCLEVRPGMDPHAVRASLWASVGRNGILMILTTVSIVLAMPVRERAENVEKPVSTSRRG